MIFELASRNPRTIRSGGDRSDLVRDFYNFAGPVRFEILKFFLVLLWSTGSGPRFFNFCWSWSGSIQDILNFYLSWSSPVRDFQNFLGPGPVQSKIFNFFWSWSVSVRGLSPFLDRFVSRFADLDRG